ncbi:MAG: HNH endonuclease [Bacteroidales bacterium]|nr:HNH endonuclease [Bacteroidales bacterium]MCF8338738.1 HNH endonuclease [Bacteroidales bacterium]
MAQNLWTREELILAFNLYCKIPFGKIDRNTPQIIELANLIGRSPNAVSWKLSNFASLDPALQNRGVKGAANRSKNDEEIWNKFFENWDELAFESEKLLARYKNQNLEKSEELEIKDGKERERKVKTRVNQNFFRTMILTSYNNRCCITNIQNPDLLIAGHIIPWAKDKSNRLNPKNGLLLNALHDKAFEHGHIAIDEEYKIHVSKEILESDNEGYKRFFVPYHLQTIREPERFLPDRGFLISHFENKFKG